MYTAERNLPVEEQSDLIYLIDRRLAELERRDLETKLTKQDFYKSLMETEILKSPGRDGLPFEFYKNAKSVYKRAHR